MGITAVALGFLDLLNADQQRRHEAALITALIGQTIKLQRVGARALHAEDLLGGFRRRLLLQQSERRAKQVAGQSWELKHIV